MESKLYVGNLSYEVSRDDLQQLFSKAGEVKEINLITDRDTGRPKGFGFVEMATSEEASKAIEMLHDQELDGRRLTVNVAKPREDRGGAGRSGGGRGGYGGGGSRGGYGGGGSRGGYGGGGKRRW